MEGTEHIIRDILASQYFAVLNSYGQGRPYSSLVSYAAASDLKHLVFVTGRNTRKFTNMRENANVSLLIDNRSNRPEDISESIAVTVIGTVQEAGRDDSPLRELYLEKHASLREFIDASENALMVVRVDEYIVAGFTETRRLVINH